MLARQGWWRPAVLAAAALSALIYVLLWDGSAQQLDNKGAVGILISLALLVVVLLLRWPQVE